MKINFKDCQKMFSALVSAPLIKLKPNWAASGPTKRLAGGSLVGLVAAHVISSLMLLKL